VSGAASHAAEAANYAAEAAGAAHVATADVAAAAADVAPAASWAWAQPNWGALVHGVSSATPLVKVALCAAAVLALALAVRLMADVCKRKPADDAPEAKLVPEA